MILESMGEECTLGPAKIARKGFGIAADVTQFFAFPRVRRELGAFAVPRFTNANLLTALSSRDRTKPIHCIRRIDYESTFLYRRRGSLNRYRNLEN